MKSWSDLDVGWAWLNFTHCRRRFHLGCAWLNISDFFVSCYVKFLLFSTRTPRDVRWRRDYDRFMAAFGKTFGFGFHPGQQDTCQTYYSVFLLALHRRKVNCQIFVMYISDRHSRHLNFTLGLTNKGLLWDFYRSLKYPRTMVLVLYMSSSFWLLEVESHDFSHAEKERTASKAEQTYKMTIISTQNGPRL